MKRVYGILLLVLLGTFALGSTAFAASEYVEQLTPDSADYAEVSTLTNRVLDAMSGMCADVTAADIDWSRAYKVYADESDVYSSYKEQQMTYDEIKEKLAGITCGFRSTSCPDQLAKALKSIKGE